MDLAKRQSTLSQRGFINFRNVKAGIAKEGPIVIQVVRTKTVSNHVTVIFCVLPSQLFRSRVRRHSG